MTSTTARLMGLSVVLSISATTRAGGGCPADLDHSGTIGVQDLNQLLSGWQSGPAGDINGDGDTDVEDLNLLLSGWGSDCPPSATELFEGRVFRVCEIGGTFLTPDYDFHPPAVADFNNDGLPDLVTRSDPCNKLLILFATGDRRLELGPEFTFPTSVMEIIATDLNNDGLPDIVAGTSGSGVIALLNNGEGGLSAPLFSGSGAHVDLAAADFDGDGNTDVASIDGISRVRIFYGDGRGGLTNALTVLIRQLPSDIITADINLDGRPDIVTANWSLGDLTLLYNNNGVGFLSELSVPVGAEPHAIRAGLINDDPHTDLVLIAGDDKTIRLLTNDGAGHFSAGIISPELQDVDGLVLVDPDQDNDPDLLIISSGGAPRLLQNDRGAFTPEPPSTAGSASGRNLVAADFDADGLLDIVSTFNFLGVLYRDADGGYTPPRRFASFPSVTSTTSILADLDGDADLDYAVAGSGVGIFRNEGNGTFTQTQTFAKPAPAIGLVSGDFDTDGDIDLVSIQSLGATDLLFMMRNQGDGTFVQSLFLGTGSFASAVIAGLIDADALTDFVVTHAVSNDLAVWLGAGDGSFVQQPSIPLGASPGDAALGDLNNDSHPDIAVALRSIDTVRILLGDGAGHFTPDAEFTVPDSAPTYVELADLDADGDTDLIISNTDTADIVLRRNNGAGGLGPPVVLAVMESGSTDFRAVDFDGDGDLDIVTRGVARAFLNDGNANFPDPPILYSLLASPPFLIFDFDGDGINDFVGAGSYLKGLVRRK